MTLDQLRAELERGALSPAPEHRIDMRFVNDRLATRLHQVANARSAGARMQLPFRSMPVLP